MDNQNVVKNKKLNIIITMSLQNDFAEPIENMSKSEIDKKYGHKIHIDYNETNRIWNNGLKTFVNDMITTGANMNKPNSNVIYQFLHLRDYHDNTDLSQRAELDYFGNHCIRGTHGVKFVEPMDDLITKNLAFNLAVNSNSINSFIGTNLAQDLNAIRESCGCDKNDIQIGIIGLITNVKVLFLAYDLSITYGYPNVFLCKDLCAGFEKSGHDRGIELISAVNLARVQTIEEFRKQFGL
jgi:nicotinamidase-related amidase